MTVAKYFVKVDTFWQNSADTWYGPYTSKADAQAAIDKAVEERGAHEGHGLTCNVKSQVRIWGIFTKTDARRHGMRAYMYGDSVSYLAWSLEIPGNLHNLPGDDNEYS